MDLRTAAGTWNFYYAHRDYYSRNFTSSAESNHLIRGIVSTGVLAGNIHEIELTVMVPQVEDLLS